MKKILIFGNSDSPHIIKLVDSLKNKYKVYLLSYSKRKLKGVYNYTIPLPFTSQIKPTGNNFSKIQYFISINRLKKSIEKIKPNILHVHWASSYGIPATFTNFHPLIISVWGTDVYDFPNKSLIHKWLFQRVMKKADVIMSTSYIMKQEIQRYTQKKIIVTPFGVDIKMFAPNFNKIKNDIDLNIGIVKSLEVKYGIEYLLYAFKIVKSHYPYRRIMLHIVGKGSLEQFLKSLSKKISIENNVTFWGSVRHENVSSILKTFDIAVFPSNSESFGVACIEAMACGIPVVASDVDGFKEVMIDNITGIIIPRKDVSALANALIRLIDNPDQRREMGYNGRKHVLKNYNWQENLQLFVSVYDSLNEV